jgi:mRNA-degrading endonuclease HigB of HigAB toxin-antitoxin module
MVIISKTILSDFAIHYPDVAEPLNSWHEITRRADWKNFTDIKRPLIAWMLWEMTGMYLISKAISTGSQR